MYDYTDGAAQRITLERPRDGGLLWSPKATWERDVALGGRAEGQPRHQ